MEVLGSADPSPTLMAYELLFITMRCIPVGHGVSSAPGGRHSPWPQRQGKNGNMGLGLSRVRRNPASERCLSSLVHADFLLSDMGPPRDPLGMHGLTPTAKPALQLAKVCQLVNHLFLGDLSGP